MKLTLPEFTRQDKRIILIIALIVLVFFLAVSSYFYQRLNQIASRQPQKSAIVLPSMTAYKTAEKKVLDYTVKTASADSAILTADKGDVIIADNSSSNIFFGAPPNERPAAFADLAIGQKIRVELNPDQPPRIYILTP